MVAPTLAAGFALSAMAGLAYAYVGRIIYTRSTSEASKPAIRAFALWWSALALITMVGVARDVALASGYADRDLLKTFAHLTIPPLVLGLWGLFYYLGNIFVGARRLLWPSVILYAAMYVLFVFVTVAQEPTGVTLRTWDVQVQYADQPTGWAMIGIVVLLIVPILVAVAAYASLAFRLERGEQRLRVILVSLAFLVWFGGSLLAVALGLTRVEWWGLAAKLLSLGSALLVGLAYHPPQRLRRRVGMGHEPPEASDDG